MGDISDLEAIVHISTAGMPKSQVDVVMGEQYNRKVLQSHEKNIENIWSQRLTQNPRLYNGSKFRLDSWKCENNSVLTLYLGLTCYRDYLATNWSPDVKRLHQIGKRDYGNQQAYMSDPLGVAAMVQTADDCCIFIRRSNNVGEAAGLWDVPGGHPEPEELLSIIGRDRKMEFQHIPMHQFPVEAVVEEMFDSIIREVRDEINIPRMALSEPQLLGVVGNVASAGRLGLDFFMRCSLTAREVTDLYCAGGPEAEESTNIKLVPLQDVLELDNKPMWRDMAPNAKGNVKLFQNSLKLLKKTK